MKTCRHILITFLLLLICFGNGKLFSQVRMYKYPGNPVFYGGGIDDWDYRLGKKAMIYDNGIYHMWYTGSNYNGRQKMGYATSAYGIHWEKYHENPINFDISGTWERFYHHFNVLKVDSLYYLWYLAYTKDSTKGITLGWARSHDGLNWEKLPEPVFVPEPEHNWNVSDFISFSVLFRNKRFHMWYTGMEPTSYNKFTSYRIGYATSADGIHWKKHAGNPVFSAQSVALNDEYRLMVNSVVYNGSGFDMFYSYWNGVCWQIGHAASRDGLSWIDSGKYPVIGAGDLGSWDSWLAASPLAILRDTVYHIWYNGEDKRRKHYGYATTSMNLARDWEQDSIFAAPKFIWVRVFNREERITSDSLEHVLPGLNGKVKADAMNKLALAYSLYKPEKSSAYARQALSLSNAIVYPQGKAMALFVLGNSQYVQDNYTEAIRNQLHALRIYDSLNMHFEAGNIYSQIASIQTYAGSHDLACKYHMKALQELLNIHDTFSVINTLEFLGYSQLMNGDTSLAINTFNRRINYAQKTRRYARLAEAFEALGQCYTGRDLDSAVYCLNMAGMIWDSLDMRNHLSFNDMLIAEAYEGEGQAYFGEALKYYERSANDYRSSSWFRVRLYYRLANLEFRMGRYSMAREVLYKAFRLCRNYLKQQDHRMFTYLNEKLEFETLHIQHMQKILELYFQLEKANKDEKKALEYYMLASQWKDSIHDDQSRKQWAMLQGEYETERAENKIQYLEKENEVSHIKVRQSRVYIVAMGFFILILALVAILFVRQNKARAEHRNVLLEQKMLRLQMNPHFVYNSLSDLQGFIWSEDKLKANDYLSSFSRLMRLILENSRQDFVPVEKEISAIEHYLKLQSLRYQGRFEYKLEVDEEIDEEHMLIPPMLSQPFIENSIEHGILNKGSTGHIEVKFTLKHDIINIDVIDDGIGFSGSTALKKDKQPEHESLAMQITRERLLLIYRKYKQKINFTFTDILDDENKVKGARVSFAVPFSLI